MEDRLIVTASPHIREASTTRGLMGNVVIALLPAVIAAGLIFGVQALVLVAVTTLACVAFEYLYEVLLKKAQHRWGFVCRCHRHHSGTEYARGYAALDCRCGCLCGHCHHQAAVWRSGLQLRQPRTGGPYRAVPRLHLPYDRLCLPRYGGGRAGLRHAAGCGRQDQPEPAGFVPRLPRRYDG